MKYAGFVASYLDGDVVVVHSRSSHIPRWSSIKKVNGVPVLKWLEGYVKYASPKTENPEVNLRRASAFLSVYNPFNPVQSITITKPETKKQIKVKADYIVAKKALFADKVVPKLSAGSLHSLIHKVIYVKLEEDPL